MLLLATVTNTLHALCQTPSNGRTVTATVRCVRCFRSFHQRISINQNYFIVRPFVDDTSAVSGRWSLMHFSTVDWSLDRGNGCVFFCSDVVMIRLAPVLLLAALCAADELPYAPKNDYAPPSGECAKVRCGVILSTVNAAVLEVYYGAAVQRRKITHVRKLLLYVESHKFKCKV